MKEISQLGPGLRKTLQGQLGVWMCQLFMMENVEDGLPGFAPFSPPSHSPGYSQSDPSELQNNVSLPHCCPQSKHPTPCKVYKGLHSPAPAYFSNHLSLYSNPIPSHSTLFIFTFKTVQSHSHLRLCTLEKKMLQKSQTFAIKNQKFPNNVRWISPESLEWVGKQSVYLIFLWQPFASETGFQSMWKDIFSWSWIRFKLFQAYLLLREFQHLLQVSASYGVESCSDFLPRTFELLCHLSLRWWCDKLWAGQSCHKYSTKMPQTSSRP